MMSWQQMEKRPLRGLKRKLGPPDFYPQRPEQKEDELTPEKLKDGYRNATFREPDSEYPSAMFEGKSHSATHPTKFAKLDTQLEDTIQKVMASYSAIMARKIELNVIQDRKDKKSAQHKLTNLWHASTKPSEKDKWFRDLAGSKSLTTLAKRFPVFKGNPGPGGREILLNLSEFNISMNRAAWFIKMTAISYAQNSADLAKRRNKPPSEPSSEWTKVLSSYLGGLLEKVTEHFALSPPPPSAAPVSAAEVQMALAQWTYLTRLAKYMFDEGLLDRSEFMSWLIDTFADKAFVPEKHGVLKLYLHFLVQFASELGLSEMHGRRLSFLVCRKLATLAGESGTGKTGAAALKEKLACPHHRHVVLALAALLQSILLDCSTALVWNYLGESHPDPGFTESKLAWHCGSPLDILPCSPSHLPIPEGDGMTANRIRKVLQIAEIEVMERSQRVEGRWSAEKSQASGLGWMVPQMLGVLEELDKAPGDRGGSVEALYPRLFGDEAPSAPSPKEEDGGGDTAIIKLLCHWAVSSQREGSYRALLVVRLLQQREKELERGGDAKAYAAQAALLDFLDAEAPVFEATDKGRLEFESLVRLYSELIRGDLFSHNRYMATLIARGETPSSSEGLFPEPKQAPSFQLGRPVSQEDQPDFSPMDANDPTKVDLGRSLAILDGDASAGPATPAAPNGLGSLSPNTASLPRHQQYMLHFPVPQDEDYRHECNQRTTLIFGFGAGRETHRLQLKKLEKDLSRIWSKKVCVKIAEGCKEMRPKMELSPAILLQVTGRFRSLAHFDQEVVSGWAINGWLERVREWERGERDLLPAPASLDLLLHLLHRTANAAAIIDFADELSSLLVSVEARMRTWAPGVSGVYGARTALVLIGFLRAHYAYFLLCHDELTNIFRELLKVVHPPTASGRSTPPGPANSYQRAVWVFLWDLSRSQPGLLAEVGAGAAELFEAEAEGGKGSAPRRLLRVLPVKCQSVTDKPAKWAQDKFRALLANPKSGALGNGELEDLRTSEDARYSFVINSILAVISTAKAEGSSKEKLWELSSFLADVTTVYTELAPDWLGAFNALCRNSGDSKAFAQLLSSVNVGDVAGVMEPLGTLLTTLVSRSCLHPDNVLAIPTQAYVGYIKQHLEKQSSPVTAKSETGLHLTLCLIRSLLCRSEWEAQGRTAADEDWACGWGLLQLASERQLLSSTQNAMAPAAILTFLMASILSSEQLRTSAAQLRDERRKAFHALAAQVLETICGQDWIKQKFLYNDDIITDTMLLNTKIGENAPRLLRMITRRNCESELVSELKEGEAKRDRVEKLLGSLNLWNLRPTSLDLQLFLKQSGPSSHETAHALEVIARSTMDLFHNHKAAGPGGVFRVGGVDNLWLIAPLIQRLPGNVQGKVLETAALVLETGQLSRKASTSSGGADGPGTPTRGGAQSSWLLGQEPFLCLVLTCLQGQEEQRESLLKSLLKQLREYVEKVREDPGELYAADSAHELHEAVLLRLSLVGGMLETVCKGRDVDSWGLVLIQLLFSGIVTLNNNKRLFYTCLDMLCVIIHACSIPDSINSSDRSPEDNKRIYSSLIKKLKKEVGDKYQPSLKLIHQLLPFPKPMVEIVCTENFGTTAAPPSSSSGSSKASSLKGAAVLPASPSTAGPPTSSRPGLRVWEKQRLSPWELVEGLKGRGEPWSWSWFSAQRLDWTPSPVSAGLARLIAHSHYHNPAFPRPPIPGSRDKCQLMEPLHVELDPGRLQQAAAQPPHLPPPPPVLPHQMHPQSAGGMPGGQPPPGMMPNRMMVGQPMMAQGQHFPPHSMPHHPPHPQGFAGQMSHPGGLGRQDSMGGGYGQPMSSMAAQHPHMAGLMRSGSDGPPQGRMGPGPMDYGDPAMLGQPAPISGGRGSRGKRKSTGGGRGRKKSSASVTPPAPGVLPSQGGLIQQPMGYDAAYGAPQAQPPWPAQPPARAGVPQPLSQSRQAIQEMLHKRGGGQPNPQAMEMGGPPQQQRQMDPQAQMAYRQQMMQRQMSQEARMRGPNPYEYQQQQQLQQQQQQHPMGQYQQQPMNPQQYGHMGGQGGTQ